MGLGFGAPSRGEISSWAIDQENSNAIFDRFSGIAKWRKRLAVAAIIVLTVPYIGVGSVYEKFLHDAEENVELSLVLVPLIIFVWRLSTLRTINGRLLSGTIDRTRLCLFPDPVPWLFGIIALILGVPPLVTLLPDDDPRDPSLLLILLHVVVAIVLAVIVFVCLVGLPRIGYGARLAHPMLEPLCTMLVSIALAVKQCLFPDGSAVPADMQRMIALSGAIAMSAMCLAELTALHRLSLRLRYKGRPARSTA
jgi:hypothetical protein